METEFMKTIASNMFQIIFTMGAIVSLIKVKMWANGYRLYAFIRVYMAKNRYLHHPVFYTINDILKGNIIKNNVLDVARKELANDVLIIEVKLLRRVLIMNLRYIFKTSLTDYIKSYSTFTNQAIVDTFINEYRDSRTEFATKSRNALTKNGYMTQEDYNKFINIYTEYYSVYEILLYETLHVLTDRKNIYATLWDILDMHNAHLEGIIKTIGHKFNLMNSRVYGILYKGISIKGRKYNG
jgi:hypothetical protein